MPNLKSAKKRMRQNVVERTRNRTRKTLIKTYTKKVLAAVEAKDVAEAEAQFRILQKKTDKAAKVNTIHANKAGRRKSRIQKRINALKAAASE